MKTVVTTNASKLYKIKIKELGRIAEEGEVLQVTDDRYNVLTGDNAYHLKFVRDIDEKPVEANTPVEAPVEEEEEPEVIVIKPKKTTKKKTEVPAEEAKTE